MPVSSELFSAHIGLAEVISLEYTNIPGALPAEALSEAQLALFRASQTFNPSRGDFAPYAAKAVRNALNSLYAKNLRIAQIFPKSLDDAPAWSLQSIGESASSFCSAIGDSKKDVLTEVRRRESGSIVEEILNFLSPRERIVVEGIRAGKSLSEIGKDMGISKQAVHKVSNLALPKLHERLNFLGYRGLDSKGLLKSQTKTKEGAG